MAGPLPENAKDRGHLAELIFALEAKKRGFIVLTPGGDNCAMDIVLYKNGKFSKVQVKSCRNKEPNRDRYTFTTKRGGPRLHRAYDRDDVDFLALYSFDAEEFHFIPVDVVGNNHTIKIDSAGRYEQFKNNWTVFE
jgi:hypothetical protein